MYAFILMNKKLDDKHKIILSIKPQVYSERGINRSKVLWGLNKAFLCAYSVDRHLLILHDLYPRSPSPPPCFSPMAVSLDVHQVLTLLLKCIRPMSGQFSAVSS